MLNSTVSLQIRCKADLAGRTSDVSPGAEGLLPGRRDDHHAHRRVVLPALRKYNVNNPRHYLRHKQPTSLLASQTTHVITCDINNRLICVITSLLLQQFNFI